MPSASALPIPFRGYSDGFPVSNHSARRLGPNRPTCSREFAKKSSNQANKMSAITTRTTTTLPSTSPPSDRDLADEIASLKSAALVQGTGLVLIEPLSQEMRHRLEQRQHTLRNSLQEGPRTDVAMAVTDLVQAMTTARNLGERQLQALVASYVKELSGLPAWAVQRACQAIARGQVEGASLDFPPTTARLRTVVEEYVAPAAEERHDIFRLLRAPVEYQASPEEKERVIAGWKKLQESMAESLRMDAPAKPKPPPMTDEELVAHYRRPAKA
jgi:hypothetical protein